MTLQHVQIVRVRGREYRYLRKPGFPRVSLPNDVPLDHPKFLKAYAEALKQPEIAIGSSRHPPGTIGALISAAVSSERYCALSSSYRRVLRLHLSDLMERAGKARYADLRSRHVRADLSRFSRSPQRNRLKAWRWLIRWAIDTGLIEDDPTVGIRLPSMETDGHPPWSRDEISLFRVRWPMGTSQRAAFELLYWTGARISDAVRLGPMMVDEDGVLTFRQQKTGDPAHVPWTCPLPEYASGMEGDRRQCLEAMPNDAMLWLVTQSGAPRTSRGLGNLIRAAARDAGIDGRSAHGLRKSRAIALAESGATPHQIAAWTGHQTLAEVTRYTRQTDRRKAVIGNADGTESVKRSRRL